MGKLIRVQRTYYDHSLPEGSKISIIDLKDASLRLRLDYESTKLAEISTRIGFFMIQIGSL
ncbi:hypothetical protein HZS_7375 [Henneguya salminicola]|nr:hypothetical protein HZS_7375 [Henneguya salminicola]